MEKNLQVIHYISYTFKYCIRKLFITKLYKLLWFSDQDMYLQTGKPITSYSYEKLQYGPVPELAIRSDLEHLNTNKININKNSYGATIQCIEDVKFDNSFKLTKQEMFVLDNNIKNWFNKECNEMSNFIHQKLWWKYFNNGEKINHYVAYFEPNNLTEEDIKWAESIK